jgi:hypothetical protein
MGGCRKPFHQLGNTGFWARGSGETDKEEVQKFVQIRQIGTHCVVRELAVTAQIHPIVLEQGFAPQLQ